MTQFSRSLKVEWWHTGVDFYVVTPFYVVSNLYKRKTGTIIAPMPDKLVKGTLAQIGKVRLPVPCVLAFVNGCHGFVVYGVDAGRATHCAMLCFSLR